MIKEFFRLTKGKLVAFIILYVFLILVIAYATGGFVLRTCTSCTASMAGTFGFYAMSLGLTYILFCWVIHVWGRIRKLQRKA